jgi:hypothetical protein
MAVAVVLAALGACGDDDDLVREPTLTTDCHEWLERPVTAAELPLGCERPMEAGGTITRPDIVECSDGTTLWWTESLWGYVGQVGQRQSDSEDDTPDSLRGKGPESPFEAAKIACAA